MKKWWLMTVVILLFSVFGMGELLTKEEALVKWVGPGEKVFEFPSPMTSYSISYGTTLYYSSYVGADYYSSYISAEAILETRIEVNGWFWGYWLEDVPLGRLPIQLKL